MKIMWIGRPRAAAKMAVSIAMMLLALATLANPRTVHASVTYRHVVADVGAAGGACDTWASACTLHYALMIAQPGDEVWVKAGVYGPTSVYNPSRYDTISVPAGVRVYGGFGGHETASAQRNPGTHITILSGDIDGNDVNTDGNHIDETALDHRGGNSYTVVTIDGTNTPITSSTVLDGFTITGGHGEGGPRTGGGGLYCNGRSGGRCSPYLNNLSFSGNSSYAGGAIQNDGLLGESSPILTNVTFQGNRAHFGGALDNNGYSGISSPTLMNVTFHGNWVENCCGGAYGGAIENRGALGDSTPLLTNVTFYGNGAQTGGGAIYNNGSQGRADALLSNVILWNDLSPTGHEIWNSSAYPRINHSDVDGGCGSIAGAQCGAGNINGDPLLSPFGRYGGSTKTMPLQINSPAVDGGTNTGCPEADQRGISRPRDGDADGTALCDMGATESRRVTANFVSAGAYDGWVLESGETTNVGGSLNSTATTFSLGDNAANKQYRLFLSFNTSSLPDNATTTAVTLKILKSALVGTSPFSSLGNIVVDMRKGAFSNDVNLQLLDFQSAPTVLAAMSITNNPVSGWYSKSLPSMWTGFINTTGVTQFRLRFATDDNNNHLADYLTFYSGNALTASDRPQLLVRYYVP